MNAYVVDSTISRHSDSFFHTSGYFGDDYPSPDEGISKLDEEKESMEDKYSSYIDELEQANRKLSLRLKEEFENSKKNINDECTLILRVRDEKKKIFSEHEIGRKQIKLYSVSEPSIFDQMHEFFPWGRWDSVYLQKPYTNTCIYDYDEMWKLRLIQRLNTVKEGLRNLSNTTIINVYITSKTASIFKSKIDSMKVNTKSIQSEYKVNT